LHVSGRGAVVRVEHLPKLDEAVYDGESRRVGRVGDVFGPVGNPYLSIKPARGVSEERLASLVGREVFVKG